ncbi:Inositol monophosphatase [Parasponia andersonii]|uniref:Inositol-1-monophosphatase n=1 Tax=Parasponia andersonii TaxID=3476 RepID=A0A2P5B9V2_PARAD|nr:Inositol monophosphatase [Parasponia andersonii]
MASPSIQMPNSYFSTMPKNLPLRLSHIPRSISPLNQPNHSPLPLRSPTRRVRLFNCGPSRSFSIKALISEVPNQKQYAKVAAHSTGPVPATQLIQVVETAAKTGAEVVMDAVNKPRSITYKGLTDLVTDTDKNSEAAILEEVKKNFGDHLILGEEGGIIGETASEYLWCIDPLDGTTNFAHGYPSFAVSVGVLFRGKPAAASVIFQVEFVGGPMCWNTRIFSGGGAFCNGQKVHVSQTDQVEQSLLVTGFGYEHDDAWATNIELFKEFTDISRGVRRLGAAAVDMCHVALGIAEAYWEYRLKPWDMAAGVLIAEEAGGTITCMDGGKFSVFDRSVLVSNGALHGKLLERIAPATEKLKSKNIDFSLWFKPENYSTDL